MASDQGRSVFPTCYSSQYVFETFRCSTFYCWHLKPFRRYLQFFSVNPWIGKQFLCEYCSCSSTFFSHFFNFILKRSCTLIFPRALEKLHNWVNFSIFSYLKFFSAFLSSLLMVLPFSSVNMKIVKDGNWVM